jgi:hypothetical protein
MPYDPTLSITGIQEVQQAIVQTVNAVKPRGRMGKAIKEATSHLHRYTVGITHVDTGALRASHLMKVSNTRGEIYINPNATNPRSGARTAEYGAYEHKRGGSHAFYQRAVKESGRAAANAAIATIRGGLP